MTMLLRSAHADELDERAQEFMSRHHDVTYLQAIRAILPEENHMSKHTTATAGVEVDARAKRYASQHQGISYKEAQDAVLAADPGLRTAYGQPATRRVRMATTDKRSQPAVPVSADVEREIKDWITRALEAGMVGVLPGALGQLSVEADAFKKLGMPVEEAVGRALGLFPHLRDLAGIQLRDIRRNAPENTPDPELAQGKPDYVLHLRATQLMQSTELSYREAVASVLDNDRELKVAYARS